MKTAVKTISLFLFMFIFFSCAERVDTIQNVYESNLKVLSITQTAGWARDVWVSGNRAFIADDAQGIAIWDITNLYSPLLIDTIQTDYPVTRVSYAPKSKVTFAYMPDSNITFFDSTKRRRLTSMDAGLGDFEVMEISADTFAIAAVDRIDNFESLRIQMFSHNSDTNVWTFVFKSKYAGPGNRSTALGLCYDNEYIYVAYDQMGLTIMKIQYIFKSVLYTMAGNVDTPGSAREVVLNADKTHAIVADYSAGISIIDITDKSNPTYITSLIPENVDKMFDVFAVGDTVYALDDNRAMIAFDVSIPAEPRVIGRYEFPTPRRLFVTDDHTIFLADQDLGLVILSWED